jgi:hypothetical protein
LKLQYHKLLSTVAFNFNLRRYVTAAQLARDSLPALDFIAESEAGPLAARLVATLLTAIAATFATAPDWSGVEAGAYPRPLFSLT